jgi:plasmid stabilization system protein ParE
MEVIFTDRFLNRVEEFSDYIALDHIPTAIKWARGVFDQCQVLSNQPESGRIVPEFKRPKIREVIHGSYRLVYEIKSNQIDMLTIWHTRQMLPDDPYKAV